MKKILFLALMALVSVSAQAKPGEPREQIVGISDAFFPSGFDSTSEAFIVVSGIFPNGCYQYNNAKVDHVGSALHEVRAYAKVTEGLCLMVLVPFQKEVQLGKLAVGEHAIRFINGDGTYWEKRLTIEQ